MPHYLQDQVYRCHAWLASSRWDETRAVTIGAAFLGEPRLAEPVTGIGFEIERGHVAQDQRGRSERRVPAHAAANRCRHDGSAWTGSRRLSVAWQAGPIPASASTRSESNLLAGSMIHANTRSRNTSSPPVATVKPSVSQARHNASHTCSIREDTISNAPEATTTSRPRSNSSCARGRAASGCVVDVAVEGEGCLVAVVE